MNQKNPVESESLQDLLKQFEIGPSDWHSLLVGDGSATTWEHSAGWSSVLIQKHVPGRKPFYGGMSCGTNNVAGLMAVLHPLMYIANNQKELPVGGHHVHVITDSSYVANGLEHDNPVWISGLGKNRELWMALYALRRKGIIPHPHHIIRDTIELNRVSHDLANESRVAMNLIIPDQDRIMKSNAV